VLHNSGVNPSGRPVRTLDAILDRVVTTLDVGTRIPAGPHHDGIYAPNAVRRDDLAWGDSLLVTTRNSIYTISRAGVDSWFVWGGWFERQGQTPAQVGINGCTWGGSVIHADILAAPGLFLEFANGVTTTRIRSALVLPASSRLSSVRR